MFRRRWPQFSLATLFLLTACVAVYLGYLRSQQRDVLHSGGSFTTGSGAYSQEGVDLAAASVKSLLLSQGYAGSPAPTLPNATLDETEHWDWFRRDCRPGEIYVGVFHGPTPVNAHSLTIRVLGRKAEGPFTNPVRLRQSRIEFQTYSASGGEKIRFGFIE
jgi:hypothetical protein